MDLRPGYKQTEIGPIPIDWKFDELNRFWAVTDCKHVTAPFVRVGFPLASIRETQSRILDLSEANCTTEDYYLKMVEGGRKPEPGDLIFSRNATVGEIAQVTPMHPPFAMGQDVCLLRKRDQCYSTDFVQYFLKSPFAVSQISDAMVGSTFKRMNVAQIKSLKVIMPPPAEQHAISAVLSDADAQIAGIEALISKNRDLRAAARQALLTGQTRLPGFCEEWISFKVGECIQRHFCGPSPTCEERNIHGDREWGVLKTTAITWEDGWDWTKHKVLPIAHWGKSSIEISHGDVIVTKAGPRHRVGVSACVSFVPPRIVVSGKMIALRPNPSKALGPMLSSAIAAREAQIFLDQRTTGMAESQVNFENDVLLETPIVLPKVDEQAAIIDVLNDMDAEITALEARLEKTRALKLGMMQALLTGRVCLPVQAEALDALEVAHA